jgi:hypothetical protein
MRGPEMRRSDMSNPQNKRPQTSRPVMRRPKVSVSRITLPRRHGIGDMGWETWDGIYYKLGQLKLVAVMKTKRLDL